MTRPATARAPTALKWRAVEQVVVKLVFLVRTPVLAWLLVPEDFGLLAIGLVSLDILLRLTEVGMIPALVQKERPSELHYAVAWNVGVVRSLLVALGVLVAAPFIAGLFGNPEATPIIQLLGLRPLLQALSSIGVADLRRSLDFRSLAILRLTDTGVDTVLAIALAPIFGVWALVAGSLAGPLAHLALSYVLAPRRVALTLDRTAAASLVRFGRWIFLNGIIVLAGRFILQAVIARQLGLAELGLYYLASKIATTTTEISYELIGSVSFPLFSRLQNDRAEAERVFRTLLQGLVIVLVPMAALLAILAPSLVGDLLGPRWLGAEHVIQIMLLATLLGAFGDAVGPIFEGLGRPSRVTILDLVHTTFLALLAWEAARRFGLVGAAASWVPAAAVTQIVAWWMLRGVFPRPLEGLGRTLLVVVGASALGSILAWGIDTGLGGLPGLFLGAGTGAGTVLVGLLMADRAGALSLVAGLEALSPRLVRMLRQTGLVRAGDGRP